MGCGVAGLLGPACAQGWRATSDKGHHAAVFEGEAQAIGLRHARFHEIDALRDWRNRKGGAAVMSRAAPSAFDKP